jgi:hypothetical protein
MSNDMSIIFGIALFLMAIGAMIPVINSSFASTYTTTVNGTEQYNSMTGNSGDHPNNCDRVYKTEYEALYGINLSMYTYTLTGIYFIMNDSTAASYGLAPCTPAQATSTSIWSVIGSAFGMLIWSFGGIPIWLDATLFMALRITLVLIIARNIWIGGGG